MLKNGKLKLLSYKNKDNIYIDLKSSVLLFFLNLMVIDDIGSINFLFKVFLINHDKFFYYNSNKNPSNNWRHLSCKNMLSVMYFEFQLVNVLLHEALHIIPHFFNSS